MVMAVVTSIVSGNSNSSSSSDGRRVVPFLSGLT